MYGQTKIKTVIVASTDCYYDNDDVNIDTTSKVKQRRGKRGVIPDRR